MDRNGHTLSAGDLVDRRQDSDHPIRSCHRSLTTGYRLPRPTLAPRWSSNSRACHGR